MFSSLFSSVETLRLDHHGLVSSVCHDLDLPNLINQRLSPDSDRRTLSFGGGVLAMILNGLGFVNRRLYLTPQFFENKPVQALLQEDVCASEINDDSLGRTLERSPITVQAVCLVRLL